jgi:hypothetical protein
MTWQAHMRVRSVSECNQHGITTVLASAVAGEPFVTNRVLRYEDGKPITEPTEIPSIGSNTEGEIAMVSLGLSITGPVTLMVGDSLTVTGHFTAS